MGFISLLMLGFGIFLMNKSYTSRYFEEIETYTNAVTEWNTKIGSDFQKIGDIYLLPEKCQDISDSKTCKTH